VLVRGVQKVKKVLVLMRRAGERGNSRWQEASAEEAKEWQLL